MATYKPEPYEVDYHSCPICTLTATTYEDVKTLFGYRNNRGYMMVQPECRECRKLTPDERAKKKKECQGE
jgi:hypothetical protein